MSDTNKALKNSSWIFFLSVFNSLFSFLAYSVVSRHLDLDSYGRLQVLINILLLIQTTEAITHPNILKKLFIEKPDLIPSIIKTSQKTIITVNTISIIALVIYHFFYKATIDNIYLLILLLGQYFRVFIYYSFLLDSQLVSKKTQFYQLVSNVISTSLRIIFAIIAPGLLLQSISFSFNYIANYFLHKKSFTKIYRPTKLNQIEDIEILKNILKHSTPLFFITLLTFLTFRVDIFILNYFNMTKEISLYSNAVKLSEPWIILSGAITSSFFPVILKSKNISLKKYYNQYRKTFFILFWTSISISIITFTLAEKIIQILFGYQYLQSASLLKVHIWSNVFIFLSSAVSTLENFENLNKISLLKYSSATALNITINFMLIPKYGAIGCSYASLITYFYISFMFNLFYKKGRYINKIIISSVFEFRFFKTIFRMADQIYSKLKKTSL